MPGRFKGDRAGGSVSSTKASERIFLCKRLHAQLLVAFLTAGSQHRFGEAWSERAERQDQSLEGKLMGEKEG